MKNSKRDLEKKNCLRPQADGSIFKPGLTGNNIRTDPNKEKKEVERFFYNLAEFVFEYYHDSRRILASLAKFFLKSLFATMHVTITDEN